MFAKGKGNAQPIYIFKVNDKPENELETARYILLTISVINIFQKNEILTVMFNECDPKFSSGSLNLFQFSEGVLPQSLKKNTYG